MEGNHWFSAPNLSVGWAFSVSLADRFGLGW
jgi:hypothetical protein